MTEPEKEEKLMSACRRTFVAIEEFEAAVKEFLADRSMPSGEGEIGKSEPHQADEPQNYLAKYDL